MWKVTTLSMPNRMIEPHGKVIASATPRSSASRASGAEACTLVPPSSVTIWPIVLVAGRTFMPLMSVGSTQLLLAVEGAGVVDEGEAERARPSSPSPRTARYQASIAAEPPLALAKMNGRPAPAITGKRPGW